MTLLKILCALAFVVVVVLIVFALWLGVLIDD
jgi:hypothetical protein